MDIARQQNLVWCEYELQLGHAGVAVTARQCQHPFLLQHDAAVVALPAYVAAAWSVRSVTTPVFRASVNLTLFSVPCSPSTALYRGPSDVAACRQAAAQLPELRPRMLDIMAGWSAEARAARTELGLEYRVYYERWKERQDGEHPPDRKLLSLKYPTAAHVPGRQKDACAQQHN